MKTIWLAAFIVSSGLLILTLAKKNAFQWIGYIGLQFIAALVFLYVLNFFGNHVNFHLPINAVTILTIGIFGIPGTLLLAALKLTLI